jgi:ElaB/YqjD/DUF883 family membrane-anchored ribosome-binding protein
MERDANDTFGNPNTSGSTTGSSAGFDAGMSGMQDTATAASDKLADAGSSVRERAGNFKHTIADALQSGAERLRRQRSGGELATAAAGTADTIADDSRIAQTSDQLAGGLQGAADWIRDADLDGLKAGIEKQVKEHPGRSLAIAIGVGYLLGKAIRR